MKKTVVFYDEMQECIQKYSVIYESLKEILSEIRNLEHESDSKTADRIEEYSREISSSLEKIGSNILLLKKFSCNYSDTEQYLTKMIRSRLMVNYKNKSADYIIIKSLADVEESSLIENKTLKHESWITGRLIKKK